MSELNIKLVPPADPRLHEQRTSSYLLNVEVLEDLRQAIKEAKESCPAPAASTRKSK
jgi:ferredoxin